MEKRVGLFAVAVLTFAMAGCAVGTEGPENDEGHGTYTTSGTIEQQAPSADVGEANTERQRIFATPDWRDRPYDPLDQFKIEKPNLPTPDPGPGM